MNKIIIHKEIIETTDPRLKRMVHHDSRSKNFIFDTTGISIGNVEHKRLVPVFDQGQIGKCTSEAAIGCINTEPFKQEKYQVFAPNGDGTDAFYSAEEELDHNGHFPPVDVGSSGLTAAKVLKNVGAISSYRHTFSLENALKAVMKSPVITGTNWHEGMYTPDADGRVHPNGNVVGGHEYIIYKIDADNGRVWCQNSWGTSWGINGTFYLTWEDYSKLLKENGDVTVFIQ